MRSVRAGFETKISQTCVPRHNQHGGLRLRHMNLAGEPDGPKLLPGPLRSTALAVVPAHEILIALR
jgi:hypothetical protein